MLRERRKSLGLTQAALSILLDVSRNTVARWERGEVPILHPGMIERALTSFELEQQKMGA
jgi:transcriptional regulator with XRE-family HTH domain